VRAARQALARFAAEAGAPAEKVEAIRLATSEALTNVVLHAYERREGEMHVDANVVADQIAVQIADDGIGLRPRIDKGGLGLGLALIAQACDELGIVKRADGGTELRMRFGLNCHR
jgi:stage II sporulation protein AB (anti-sigma F factor)